MPTQSVRAPSRFSGSPNLPGDKSISHRALIFGALATGRTEVIEPLESGDVHSTARCLEALGVKLARRGRAIVVEGVGYDGLR
ncbi:MAG: 3-phosphoshikimate 1-carboxyvinyltransferase, partial [Bdellovibrionota bacterium]